MAKNIKNIKKFVYFFIIIGMLSISTISVFAAENESSDIKVNVDGKYLSFMVPPTIIDGTTLVPLRTIFEALGAQVSWEEETMTVTGIKGNIKIVLQIDNKYAYINGNEFELAVPGTLIEGSTMVPARFIAESLGADVEWEESTSTVLITSDKVVNFPDVNFKNLIRALTGKSRGDILTSDLRKITALNGGDKKISNIEGIQYLTKAEYINLNNNSISDIRPLASLKRLDSLYLNNNIISDITPLTDLTGLETLDLSSNRIKDIRPLAGLISLNSLGLGDNLIFDLEPLRNLINLDNLHLPRNQFTNITPLKELENLNQLYIYDNAVIDIDPLKKLKNLSVLRLESYDKNEKIDSDLFGKYAEMTWKARLIIGEVIKPGMTDYEKELALHDYIVTHTIYDSENVSKNTVPREAHIPYGVLTKGSAVCDGYAYTMKILLDMAGIESYTVTGKLLGWQEGDAGHAWNIVKINGEYFHLDATWDDPVSTEEAGQLKHVYFNLSDKQILATHMFDTAKYPDCRKDSQEYNQFIKEYKTVDYSDGWIYSTDEKGYIYKMKTDGIQVAKIGDDKGYCINYINGSIIYINRDDGKIYTIDTEGKVKKKIKDEPCIYVKVYNGWIYYTTGKNERNSEMEYKILRMKPDGSQDTMLSYGVISTLFTIEKDWIYYRAFDFSSNGTLNKIKIDGNSKRKLSEDQIPGFNVSVIPGGRSVSFSTMNFEVYSNGWIYYTNLSDGGKIYKIDNEGSSKTLVCKDRASDIELIGSWIYYKNDGDGKYYRIRTDGSERQILK